MSGFWHWLDTLAHKIHLPFRGWICDQYDMSLGITRDELKRNGPGSFTINSYRPFILPMPSTEFGTFSCPHMSVSGVSSASCGQCGPFEGSGVRDRIWSALYAAAWNLPYAVAFALLGGCAAFLGYLFYCGATAR